MYWSTKDARRRCVYSLRIVEVRPEALKSPTITMKDMTIIHDSLHPDFVPLSNLDLSSYGINLRQGDTSQLSICDLTESESPVVNLTGSNMCNEVLRTEESVDLTQNTTAENTMNLSQDSEMETDMKLKADTNKSCFENKTFESKVLTRSASFGSLPSKVKEVKEQLSSSWPQQNLKAAKSDLRFLSPNTLKLLNIKDPSKYLKPIKEIDKDERNGVNDGEFKLLKIADRLNNAAAKSSKRNDGTLSPRQHSRSPSLERSLSPQVNGYLSPIPNARSFRSQSLERASSPLVQGSSPKLVSLLNKLPDRPFSPPFRMFARSRSLSVDKEIMLSRSEVGSVEVGMSDCEPFLPRFNPNEPVLLRRGRSVSDPVSPSSLKPLGTSSPVAQKNRSYITQENRKTVVSDVSTLNDSNENTDIDSMPVTDKEVDSEPTESEPVSQTSYSASAEESGDVAIESSTTNDGHCGDQSLAGTNNFGSITSDSIDTSAVEVLEGADTIVVMTDSGESISEEEAVRIVQEVLDNQLVQIENAENDVNDSNDENAFKGVVRSTKNSNDLNVELEGSASDVQMQLNGDDDMEAVKTVLENITNTIEGSIEKSCNKTVTGTQINEEKPPSPFIPKMNDSNSPVGPKFRGIVQTKVRLLSDKEIEQRKKNELSNQNKNPQSAQTVGWKNGLTDDKMYGANDKQKIVPISESCSKDVEEGVSNFGNSPEKKEANNRSMPVVNDRKMIQVDSDSNSDIIDITESLMQENEKNVSLGSHERDNESVSSDIELLEDLNNVNKESEISDNGGIGGLSNNSKICEKSLDDKTSKNSNDEIDGDQSCVFIIDEEGHSKMLSSDTLNIQDMPISADEIHILEENCNPEFKKTETNIEAQSEKEEKSGKDTCQNDHIQARSVASDVQQTTPIESPQVAVKVYPLRQNVVSPLRYRNSIISPISKSCDGGQNIELPVLDPVAKRIKEESIAKSCPGEKGPFKCCNCRRMYRTESSYKIHVDNCNFCLSSSDDDSNSNSTEHSKTSENSAARVTRSKRKQSMNPQDHRPDCNAEELNEGDMDDNETDSKDDEKIRPSLRQSTVYQRVAIEAEEKRIKDEIPVKRGRGRPSLNKAETVECSVEINVIKRGRGRPPLVHKEQVSKDCEPDNLNESIQKRGRGRPPLNRTANENDKLPKSDDETPKRGRGRPPLKKSSSSEEDHKNESYNKEECDIRHDEDDGTPNCNKASISRRCTRKQMRSPSPIQEDSTEQRVTRSRSQESKLSDFHSDDQSEEEVEMLKREAERTRLAELVNRKRSMGKSFRAGSVDFSSGDEIKSPELKRKCFVTDEELVGEETNNSNDVVCEKQHRRGRRRSRRGLHMKKKTCVTDKTEVAEDQIGMSSDETEVLDPETGFIVNSKTGEIITNPNDLVEKESADKVQEAQNQSNLHEFKSENNCIGNGNAAESSSNKQLETTTSEITTTKVTAEFEENTENPGIQEEVKTDKDDTSCSKFSNDTNDSQPVPPENTNDIESTEKDVAEKFQFSDSAIEDSNKMKTVPLEAEMTDSCTKQVDSQEDDPSLLEGKKNENTEGMPHEDSTVHEKKNNSPLPGSLPETVIKLLKEGHKVVIRNPKTNKNYVWQKTDKGYIGKPFDKELPSKPSKNVKKTNPENKEEGNKIKTTVKKSAKQMLEEKLKKSKCSGNPYRNTNNNNSETFSRSKKDTNLQTEKPVTASDILFKRMKDEKQKSSENTSSPVLSSVLQSSTGDILKKNAHILEENIARLINMNKEKAEKSGMPEKMAEYVGGIVIAPNKPQVLSSCQQMINNTVSVATFALQSSFQMQNQASNAFPIGTGAQTGLLSTLVPAASTNVLHGMPQVQFPIIQQQLPQLNSLSPGQSALVPGLMNNLSTGGLQTLNQAALTCLSPPMGTGLATVGQIPVVEMGIIGLPVQTQIPLQNGHSHPLQHQQGTNSLRTILPNYSLMQSTQGVNVSSGILSAVPVTTSPLISPILQVSSVSGQQSSVGMTSVSVMPSFSNFSTVNGTLSMPSLSTASALATQTSNNQNVISNNFTKTELNADRQPSQNDSFNNLSPFQKIQPKAHISPTACKIQLKAHTSPTACKIPETSGQKDSFLRRTLKEPMKPIVTVKPGLGGGSAKLYDKMKFLMMKRNRLSAKKNLERKKSPPYQMHLSSQGMALKKKLIEKISPKKACSKSPRKLRKRSSLRKEGPKLGELHRPHVLG